MELIRLLVIAWVVSLSRIDANHLNRKQYFSDHSDRLISRLCVFLILALIEVKLALFGVAAFILVFDISLNLFRGLPWNYIGGEAVTDKFLRKHKYLFYISKAITLVWIILKI